jgi:hypothetical protein
MNQHSTLIVATIITTDGSMCSFLTALYQSTENVVIQTTLSIYETIIIDGSILHCCKINDSLHSEKIVRIT